jgi:hypothetical protein
LAEIVDAAGDRIDVLLDGGVQRGSHLLIALSGGAKAVGVERYYLFPLAARRPWRGRFASCAPRSRATCGMGNAELAKPLARWHRIMQWYDPIAAPSNEP